VGFFDWLKRVFSGPDVSGDPYKRHWPLPPHVAPELKDDPNPDERTQYQAWRTSRRPGVRYPSPNRYIAFPTSFWRGRLPDKDTVHLGGSRANPDPHHDADKVAKHRLPDVPHLDELARLLGMTRNELLRFVVRPAYSERTEGHYLIHRIPKKSGGERLLMVPLPMLKAVQRRLNEALVQHLPVHPAAHGFRRGRSVKTCAAPHAGRDVVISVDIADFFPTFTFRRVSGYFRHLGYGRGTAIALANLVTWRPGEYPIQDHGRWDCPSIPPPYDQRHPQLPQGAPTSPGIANAICMGLDKRLAALAAKFGAQYTRYADDLTFSGGEELRRKARPFLKLVEKIIASEGLKPNRKKTRIMSKGRRQQVNGVVVNEQPNLSRTDFDQLKAILHNCIKHGPASQNRDNHPDFFAHLQGRVAHAMHIGPKRGAKLKALFDRIQW